jgi:hypothetical protein
MNEGSVDLLNRGLELAPAVLLEVEGFTHIDKDKTVSLWTPPTFSVLTIGTLSGFVKLLEAGFEGFDPSKCLVQVEGFDSVTLMQTVSDKWGRRSRYVRATAPKPERNFKFNEYIGQEEFNIALRSMFVQDDELNSLVTLAGNIAKQSELKQEDDGFSQSVSAKAGVTLVKTVTIKPRVTLKPFRTFLEVDQPAGDYIFRVRSMEDRGNLCALFEADGGAWKLEAMDTIQVWLQQQMKTSSVEALHTVPVIA